MVQDASMTFPCRRVSVVSASCPICAFVVYYLSFLPYFCLQGQWTFSVNGIVRFNHWIAISDNLVVMTLLEAGWWQT
jgi:hypothetical protein